MAAVHWNKSQFEENIKSGVTFVDFWAEWCGPCKMAAPVIDELASEYEGKAKIAKVDVDAEAELAGSLGIMSIPTVILYRDGQEIGRQIGFAGKPGYLQLLSKAGI